MQYIPHPNFHITQCESFHTLAVAPRREIFHIPLTHLAEFCDAHVLACSAIMPMGYHHLGYLRNSLRGMVSADPF